MYFLAVIKPAYSFFLFRLNDILDEYTFPIGYGSYNQAKSNTLISVYDTKLADRKVEMSQ